ncbi:dihydrofolate reductase family protein [Vibrio panuliri]|uniref:Diacylglycerol kinase n=1 Tax=Vibrio panuliri TaxID=1381081 RepID=A0ABX3FCK4_9VIBR|nr:dihydrofolate reductase family protein [Vibrio panuliri]KAB1458004.1 dihydrofolate reductase [Vibrio panuliri]OLQ89633.1 diacylglycerol kinase [Vibrio panuliri]
MSNIVYIATSIDGYIADKNNQLDWLHDTPNPNTTGSDFGFANFMDQIDALVMGRNTFEMVASFDCDWPYSKPVFVLSNTLSSVPSDYQDKVFLIKGELTQVVSELNQKGYQRLYIDGGKTVQSFLEQDLIDEMIITTIPVLLGGGVPLFGDLVAPLKFTNVSTERWLDCLVQSRFVRLR